MRAPPIKENQTLLRSQPSVTGQAVVGTTRSSHTLPDGARLDEFEIVGLIGEGGFGIVYLAFDHSLERNVALKEYMPSSLASRSGGASTVTVKSEHHVETFRAGLRSFINEARLLAQFDHPALVKVHRFWEANGTAYMVMPFYEGPTLNVSLRALGTPPDEAWLKQLLDPLLDALELLHRSQCFHRDIAPDNILLTSTGPLLLDFGAARRVIGEANQGLTVILKPGYAPIEQYGEVATMGQGPWTDIYALACVVYTAITGKAPVASIERLMDDRLQPVSQLAAGRYDAKFLQAIDAGLAIKPQHRPANIEQFRSLLNGGDLSRPASGSTTIHTMQRTAQRLFANAINTQSRTMARKEVERHANAKPAAGLASKRALSTRTRYAMGGIILAVAIAVSLWMALPHLTPILPGLTRNSRPSPTATISTQQSTASERASMPSTAPTLPVMQIKSAVEQQPKTPATIQAETGARSAGAVSSAATSSNNATSAVENQPPPRVRDDMRPTQSVHQASSSMSRCSELLQKASLEALSQDEAGFLQKECK